MLGTQDGTGQGRQWLIECPAVHNYDPHLDPRSFKIFAYLIIEHNIYTSRPTKGNLFHSITFR